MKKKLRSIFFLIFVFGILLYVIVISVWHSDKTLPQVESWLISNTQLIDKVGIVKQLKVTSSTYVTESSTAPAHKKYSFQAVGKEGNATVKVRVDEKGKFSIYEIE